MSGTGASGVVPILATLLLVNFFAAIGYWMRRYQIFYRYMKRHHSDAWWELMRRDSMIEALGEWIRWPFGSWQLIVFYHRNQDDLADARLDEIKRFAKPTGAWVLGAFAGVIVGTSLLPFIARTLSTGGP